MAEVWWCTTSEVSALGACVRGFSFSTKLIEKVTFRLCHLTILAQHII